MKIIDKPGTADDALALLDRGRREAKQLEQRRDATAARYSGTA